MLFSCDQIFWCIQPDPNEREWNPNFSVLPSFEIDGKAVTAHNVRNTQYQTEDEFTPRYETRNYDNPCLASSSAA
jgi:hypothetical protein